MYHRRLTKAAFKQNTAQVFVVRRNPPDTTQCKTPPILMTAHRLSYHLNKWACACTSVLLFFFFKCKCGKEIKQIFLHESTHKDFSYNFLKGPGHPDYKLSRPVSGANSYPGFELKFQSSRVKYR